MAIRMEDKDLEIRRKNDVAMRELGVQTTRRSNPLKEVRAKDGTVYLCGAYVDESKDLRAQGCIDFDRIAVTGHA